MQQSTLLENHLVYVECLSVGKFSQRRWNGPAIDESVYDFSESEVEPSPANTAASSGFLWDRDSERTTLPKAVVSGEVLSTLRQWWANLRSGKQAAAS